MGNVEEDARGLSRDINVLTVFSASFSSCFISGSGLLSLIRMSVVHYGTQPFFSFKTAGMPATLSCVGQADCCVNCSILPFLPLNPTPLISDRCSNCSGHV